jgi:hypothetical protein
MKRLIVVLSLAAAALSGCAELKNALAEPQASGGPSGLEETRPYPKSASDLGLF